MIGESTRALVFIRTSIFLLRCITPGAFLYWALTLLSPKLSTCSTIFELGLFDWRSTNVGVWALRIFTANEVWFYFWSQAKTRQYQMNSECERQLTHAERQKLFDQVLNAVDNPRAFLSGWFMGADLEQIKRGNMTEWILWAFFNQGSREAFDDRHPQAMTDEIEHYIQQWEKATGTTVGQGYNDKVKCIRLNADPVRTVHRPACVYIGVGVLYDFLGWITYHRLGLRHYVPSASSGHRIRYPYIGLPSRPSDSVLTYWYRPAPVSPRGEREGLPFVFIHGIGAGLKIYKEMISKISRENPRSAIYLIEVPCVTMKFTDKLPRKREFVEAVESLLHANGHSEALFSGHSLGTVVTTWIIHLKPRLCRRIILIDPVCFLLHLPDVAFNFLHRRPRTANHWLYWYFVSNEPGIAWFLGRGFFWFENVLWLEELPRDACEMTVFLSENDMIVDVPSVFRYLTHESIPFNTTDKLQSGEKVVRRNKHNVGLVTVLWSGPDMDHAVFLLMHGPSADVVSQVHASIESANHENKVQT